MKRVWNVTPYSLMIDARKPAVRSCQSTMVEDVVAAEWTAGPDWAYENPRKPPERLTVRKSRIAAVLTPVDEIASMDMVAEGSPDAIKE